MFDYFGSQYLKNVLNEMEILILRLDIVCITLHPTGAETYLLKVRKYLKILIKISLIR